MSGNAGRERAERFWQAWERGDAVGLPPEDRALFALGQRMAQEGLPAPDHRARLWAALTVRWRASQRRRWMMTQRTTLRRGLGVALMLGLLIALLGWGIRRLRPQPSPAAAVSPTPERRAPRLTPATCPQSLPPVDGNRPPTDAATLGGGSVQVDGFWFTLLAYCDPTLQDSAVGGLGVWVQWDYDGPSLAGLVYEQWGPEGGGRDTATLDATDSLPAPVSHWGGWRLPADAVNFDQPQITLTFVEQLDTPRGEFGARLLITLRRSASGWLVDNVTVKPLSFLTPTPLSAESTPAPDASAEAATATPPPFTYRVGRGDTCESLAWKFHVPLDALLQANHLSPSCSLEVGMALAVPPSPWNPPERLSLDAGPEQVRAKVLAPSWQTVWLAGTYTTWTNGEGQQVYAQASLTGEGEGWLAVSAPQRLDEMGTKPRWSLSRLLASRPDTQEHHPLPGAHPLLDSVYPLVLSDPALSPIPRFQEVWAGRLALVVDWGAYRLWVDEDSGLILRSEHYRSGSPPEGDLDAVVDWQMVVYDPQDVPATVADFMTPPWPTTPDPSDAWLRFESTRTGDPPDKGNLAARLYADDLYLGALDLGQPDDLGCDRSPNGRQLAWVYHDSGRGRLLAWTPVGQPVGASVGFDLPQPLGPPTWAPDSRQVAYVGCQDATCGLFVVDVATGQARWLHAQADDTAPPLWSPDGASLAVLHPTGSGLEVVVARVADGAVTYRGAFDAERWQPAPDAPLTAWERNFPREVGSFSRCTAPPTAGQAASVPPDLADQPLRFTLHANAGFRDNSVLAEVSTADGQRLGVLDLGGTSDPLCRRSPDGLYLAYARFPNAANAQTATIRLVDLRDLAHPRDLAYAAAPSLAFSPTGEWLAVLGDRSPTATEQTVSLFDWTTGALRWRTARFPQEAFLQSLAWRPDGAALAVVGALAKTPHVWVLEASDGSLLLDEALDEGFQPRPGSSLVDWGVTFLDDSPGGGLEACSDRP